MTTIPNYVITVGRQFGSGGRKLGRALADRLAISFYDKRLLVEAAQASGMTLELFEKNDERFPRFVSGIFSFAQGCMPLSTGAGNSALSSDRFYSVMCDFMHELAGRESCVIVGRTSDYVLRDHPHCVNLFVHAPMSHCVANILERGECEDADKARSKAEKVNRLRSEFYNFYTDKRWGDAASYDLTIDSSSVSLDDAVELVVSYLRMRGIPVR